MPKKSGFLLKNKIICPEQLEITQTLVSRCLSYTCSIIIPSKMNAALLKLSTAFDSLSPSKVIQKMTGVRFLQGQKHYPKTN